MEKILCVILSILMHMFMLQSHKLQYISDQHGMVGRAHHYAFHPATQKLPKCCLQKPFQCWSHTVCHAQDVSQEQNLHLTEYNLHL